MSDSEPAEDVSFRPQGLVETLETQKALDDLLKVVRRIAQRWVEGLRALLGVAGVAGIIGAPFAIESLNDGTRLVVGLFLAGVIACAAIGLLLVMSAAYGGTRMVQGKKSPAEIRTEAALRSLKFLRTGRWLTVAAFFLLAGAVVWAWAGPRPDDPANVIVRTRAGGEHCGAVVPAPDAHLGVQPEGRARGLDIPVGEIVAVHPIENC